MSLLAGTVSVISDTSNIVVATVTVGSTPRYLSYDSGTNEIFVANQATNTVSVIDSATNTVTNTISVGSGPFGVAYDSGTGKIYVANNVLEPYP